jgi:hypothetical protein
MTVPSLRSGPHIDGTLVHGFGITFFGRTAPSGHGSVSEGGVPWNAVLNI